MTPEEQIGALDQGQRNHILIELAWRLDYFGVVTRNDWNRVYADLKGEA